jgi:MFS family permease
VSTAPAVLAPEQDASLTGFYKDMTLPERRAFWGCAAGWGLDGMDYMIYPLVIGTIMAQWGIAAGSAGLAVTLTLLFSALGGWLAGYLSDRIGRVRTLQITILWFSGFSVLCAFAQNFEQLIIFRALLGLGFGGEWAVGAILMGETIRAQYRGRAVGCVQSGWAIGYAIAVLSQAVLFSALPSEQAWRAMFVVGCLPALLVFYLRRFVEEPQIAAAARAKQAASLDRPAIWEIFSSPVSKVTILATIMCIGAQGGNYAVATWLPTFLIEARGLTVIGSSSYLLINILGMFTGYLTGAWLADRLGRRLMFLLFSAGAISVVLLYTQLQISPGLMLVAGFPLGFFTYGYFSGMGPFLTELFPTRLRGSGQGFCYNFGRGLGATFPTVVGYLSSSMPLADAMAIFAVIGYAIFFAAAFALPETRGKVLDANG